MPTCGACAFWAYGYCNVEPSTEGMEIEEEFPCCRHFARLDDKYGWVDLQSHFGLQVVPNLVRQVMASDNDPLESN